MNSDIQISSVSEFIEHILQEHRSGPSFRESEISCISFYRGQANHNWNLSPRLFREGLFQKERALIEEIRRLYPSEFSGMEYFDQLVKMQHYGIPTRLLDTTLNPLVALFFACYEHEQIHKDGCVYVFPRLPVYRPRHWQILVSMVYSFEISASRVNLEIASKLINAIPSIEDRVVGTPEEIVKVCVAGWPFSAVIPNLNNRRVQNQDGAFLLCNMQESNEPAGHERSGKHAKLTCFEPRDIHEALLAWKGTFSVKIPAQNKPRILEELSLIGINRSKLFPELEHQAELVIREIKGSTTEC